MQIRRSARGPDSAVQRHAFAPKPFAPQRPGYGLGIPVERCAKHFRPLKFMRGLAHGRNRRIAHQIELSESLQVRGIQVCREPDESYARLERCAPGGCAVEDALDKELADPIRRTVSL